MNGRRLGRWVLAGAGVAALVVAYTVLYGLPSAELRRQLDEADRVIGARTTALEQGKRVGDRLREIAATTLGATQTIADSRFRDTTNALASSCGLMDIRVSTSDPKPVESPADKTKIRGLSKQVDFHVIAGELKGTGSLDQVIRAAATIQAQPWIHRVPSLSIKPAGGNSDLFELRLGLESLFIPNLVASDAPQPQGVALGEAVALIWEPVVRKNPFREPPPLPEPTVITRNEPSTVPPDSLGHVPPPYGDWKLTGVTISRRLGLAAYLVNLRTGQQLALGVGASVADATLVGGEGERVIFEIAGQRYEVTQGQTLEQRRPTN